MEQLSIKSDRLEKRDRSLIVLVPVEAVAIFAAMECSDFTTNIGAGLPEANQRADTYVAVLVTNIKRSRFEKFSN